MASRTLFAISDDLQALYDRLDDLDGAVDAPEAEAELDTWFDTLHDERDQKIDNYAALITELEARAAARKEEAKRLRDRGRRDADHAQYLKDRLVRFLQDHDLKTVETPRYRLTAARSGGKLPVIVHADPESLPPAYQRVKVSADLDALREALERGEAAEYAELGERSTYLRIS